MNFIFHNIWVVILPIDELIFFRGVGQPPTRFRFYPFFRKHDGLCGGMVDWLDPESQ